MTTRDQARRTSELRPDPPEADGSAAGPALPERLLAARERKGVDLYRAERDTKIRARYLSALERGDYRELPGAVYVKGFLRNYALYLGLDPEDVISQWRRERGDQATAPATIEVRRPLTAPGRGLAFSPSIVVAALMTAGIVAFGFYMALQLLRFAKPPSLTVTQPATALVDAAGTDTTYLLEGASSPGSSVSVATPGRDQPYRTVTGADGTWSIQVDLRRGRNQFDITAVDPDTGKTTNTPREVVITVPFVAVQAPSLSVAQPADGTTFQNGAIPVEGTTTAGTKVVVSATWLGPVAGQAPGPSAGPSLKPAATPAAPTPVTVTAAADGSFSTPLELTAGRWSITITASSDQGKAAAVTRTVSVAYKGVNLVVTIKGGSAWLKVWLDGTIAPSVTVAGQVFRDGQTVTFSAVHSIEVRTGSSGFTYFTLNGTSLGALGNPGIPETWLFAPPNPPQKTQRT